MILGYKMYFLGIKWIFDTLGFGRQGITEVLNQSPVKPTHPKLYASYKCEHLKGLNNGGRSGAKWDLSPMPSPRPMPILPRSAVASSDFRPYSSPNSSLNVAVQPAHPKAARPPTNLPIINDNAAAKNGHDGHTHGPITTVSSAANRVPGGGFISTKA